MAEAVLAGIRERAENARTAPALTKARDWACINSARDVPALLAAVEAALKAADGWLEFPALGFLQEDCAHQVRAAITAALADVPRA
jgi:hypothetical protein